MAENERKIWDTLMEEIGNPYGVAGLMGNLMAESSLNPLCKTGGDAYLKALSGKSYINRVVSGSVGRDSFAHDGVAFGLAQWCYYSRKEGLYDYCKEHKLDISQLDSQLKFLLHEIKQYKTVWKTLKSAVSVCEASDIVLTRYEKPANTSDKVKAKRCLYGEDFYEKYSGQVRLSFQQMADILKDVVDNEMMACQKTDMMYLVIDELELLAKENSQ